MQNSAFQTITKFKQEHLIAHYEKIKDEGKKKQFLNQISNIDYQQAAQLFKHVYQESKTVKQAQEIKYEPVSHVQTRDNLKEFEKEYEELGFKSIANGQVGVCIMSGGQGTRLGFDHPKGMFNLGLKCGLTLFGFFANRLLRLSEVVCQNLKIEKKCLIKWYLMTSEMNHDEIVTYFKENKYFGYPEDCIVFFPQGGIPAVSYQGKVIIEDQGKVSLAPAGNGAIYTEMKNKKVLEHIKKNGVKYLYLGPVDNVLLKLADPISLGYMIKNNFDIVSHYLKKRSADEKVGLHVKANGKVKIIEYSEATKEVKELKDQKGNFVYNAGSRATMYVTTEFIDKITNDKEVMLSINKKYHLAEKKVKYFDEATGKMVTPTSNTGVKFELFYFDVFEETDKVGLFETIRDEEFAPLKNAEGDDSPKTAKQYLQRLNRVWGEMGGAKFQGEGEIEIHPRKSYNGEGVAELIKAKSGGELTVKLPVYFD